jgi:hypothetical protein
LQSQNSRIAIGGHHGLFKYSFLRIAKEQNGNQYYMIQRLRKCGPYISMAAEILCFGRIEKNVRIAKAARQS